MADIDTAALAPAAIAAKWVAHADTLELRIANWAGIKPEGPLAREAAEARHIARALVDSRRLDQIAEMLRNDVSVDAFWLASRATDDLRESLDAATPDARDGAK